MNKKCWTLTPRQLAYAENRLAGKTQHQSYVDAGYVVRDRRDATAKAQQVEKSEKVQQYMHSKRKTALKRADITARSVVDEIACYAFLNPKRLFDEDGRLKQIHEMEDDVARALGSIDVVQVDDKTSIRKIKLIDKSKGLEQLGRYLGMFVDKQEVNISTDLRRLSDDELAEREREQQEKWAEVERLAEMNGIKIEGVNTRVQ